MHGIGFNVYGGKAWFDRVGTITVTVPAPTTPTFPGTDTVWFDDALPSGASPWGHWAWDTAQTASGTQSNISQGGGGHTQHGFTSATSSLELAAGEKLVVYAMSSSCEQPGEIMLQFNDGSWEHRAYWGANLIGYGTNGTNSRRRIGDLPAVGDWVRLEVPVEDVGLAGRTITGMSFDVHGGQVRFDRISKAPAQSGALSIPGEIPATMIWSSGAGGERPTLWSRMKAWFRRRKEPKPPVNLGFAPVLLAQTGTPRRYSLYTPELQLLAETEFTTAATPAIAHDYVWFNGEPLAQIETSTGAIHYYFNDHLGAPILTTNSTGAVDWRVEREPYGDIFAVRAGGDRHQPLGLPGQEYDPSAPERQYNVMRWYRPSWGRYTQRDPIGLRGGVNLYAYVLGNPVRFVDPMGLVRVKCDCKEDLDKAIRNARRRMELIETTGSAFDPRGSNVITAATYCEKFGIIEPATGKKITFGQGRTTRNDRFEDGRCLFLCVSVHEAYHRKQCEYFSRLDIDLTEAQSEWPAYREELRCLESAKRNGFLNVKSNPPGEVSY